MASSIDAATVVYFITGANRGLGYGVVDKLASRPNVVIYAAARNPANADALQQLAVRHCNVRIVKLSVESDAEHEEAVRQVESEAGRVDIVLACAGILVGDAYRRTEALRIDQLREHFDVNTFGPVRLFQHLFPLLSRSSDPKFVVVSTGVASIAFQPSLPNFPVTCYALSKAAINFFAVRVHVEHPNITSFPLSPGQPSTTAHTSSCYRRSAAAGGFPRAPQPFTVLSLISPVCCAVSHRLGANRVGQHGCCHCGYEAGPADSGAECEGHSAAVGRVCS